tara:strand:+ start:4405 stop:4782 length:378 start_codon:yes stop_codon:yes gene_type:complete
VEKKMSEIENDKSRLFATVDQTMYEIKVAEDSDKIIKVWVKEPTWLQVESALSSVMDVDSKTQEMSLNLTKMYKFMVKEFIGKTEPTLSHIELLRLNPYLGAQLKEILPNPFMDIAGADTGKEVQ